MAAKAPKSQMEKLPAETYERLKQIQKEIDEHFAAIEVLECEADSLVVKHTLEECRAIGCTETHCGKYKCMMGSHCIRSKYAHGATQDYYNPPKPAYKPKVEYPTLGWKTVVCATNRSWKRPIVKETPKALFLGDHEMLLKSSIYHIEDCTYIKSRSGHSYVCADDEDSLDAHLMLLDVVHQEFVDRASRALHTPEVPEPDVRV